MFLDSDKSDKHYWLTNQEKKEKLAITISCFCDQSCMQLYFGQLVPSFGYNDKHFVAAQYLLYHVFP